MHALVVQLAELVEDRALVGRKPRGAQGARVRGLRVLVAKDHDDLVRRVGGEMLDHFAKRGILASHDRNVGNPELFKPE